MTTIGHCPKSRKHSLTEVNASEVAGISKCQTKVLTRQHKGTKCQLCGYHNCTIVIVDSKGNRVG